MSNSTNHSTQDQASGCMNAESSTWTVIKSRHGFRRNRQGSSKARQEDVTSSSPEALDDSIASDHPVAPGTVAQFKEKIDGYLRRWQNSQCRVKLMAEIGRRQHNDDSKPLANDPAQIPQSRAKPVIDIAICAGLGSLGSIDDIDYRSLWQLCVFLDVVHQLSIDRGSVLLQDEHDVDAHSPNSPSLSPRSGKVSHSNTGAQLRLLASEPRMTGLDKAVLASYKIQTVNPQLNLDREILQAALESGRTLLYAPFVAWHVLFPQIFALGSSTADTPTVHRPLLYIGTSVRVTSEYLEGIAIKRGSSKRAEKSQSPSQANEDLGDQALRQLDWQPVKLHSKMLSAKDLRRCYSIVTAVQASIVDSEWALPSFELHDTALHGLHMTMLARSDRQEASE